MTGKDDVRRESLRFEARHNSSWRYSKLSGRTPLEALKDAGVELRFPPTVEPPSEPLEKPVKGRYHVVRFIRSDAKMDLFGESIAMPGEAIHEYVWGTVDVAEQTLTLRVLDDVIDQRAYLMR